tara:strand:- start:497 stop:1075 length:579 start_codon:yes stop_codon:yes gene_type:complete
MLKKNLMKKIIDEKCALLKKIPDMHSEINLAIKKISSCVKKGGKLMLCGNGGSAADAQHLAAEFTVRLRPKVNRKPFAALSLAADTSTITACSNDYSFDKIFERNFEALYKKNDILILISTSGKSKNLINVAKLAKKKNIFTIALLGSGGGVVKKYANLNLIIPSNSTARIQELHIFLGHYIFEEVENLLIK